MVSQKYTTKVFLTYSGSQLHNINEYIANTLETYVKDENNNAMSSTTISKHILNVSIEDVKIMAPFDVTCLYTNIPILDTFNVIKYYVQNDDQSTGKGLYLERGFLI